MEVNKGETLRLQLTILRAQSGDITAFNQLYERFSSFTLVYLNRMVGLNHAEDVQQKVWLNVYKNLARLNNIYAFKSWLMQIAHRAALAFFRSEKRHLTESEAETVEVICHDSSDFDLLFEQRTQEIEMALLQISTTHREVIIFYFWQELSCREIAMILNCSVGTVKSRLHHAKQQLAKKCMALRNQINLNDEN